MINNVTLVGRIGKELNLKYTPSGVANLTFSLAVTRPFTNQQGEKETDWVNVVVWRKMAENTANFCDKGSMVGITGRIQTRNYEGQDGKRIYVTEVIAENVSFLDKKASNDDNGQSNTDTSNNSYGGGNRQQSADNGYQSRTSNNSYSRTEDDPFANDGKTIDISDDDLPF